MNQSQHDELAQLFQQSMQLSRQQQEHIQQQEQHIQALEAVVEDVPQTQQSEKQAAPQPVHYISTHYTPTAHMRPLAGVDAASEPSCSPPPPYYEAVMPEAMAEALRQHSVDPSSLLPNQVHLFLNAGDEQRLRLVELWRIAPPSYPLEEHLNSGTWISTSMEREEALARVRYEQQQQQHNHQQQQQQQQEETVQARQPQTLQVTFDISQRAPSVSPHSPSTPISPIREAGEPAWPPAARMRAASIAAKASSRPESFIANANSRPATRHGEAEPYIIDGYATEEMSRSASDPVYAAAQGLWQAPSYAQALEDQYGMYEQMRNYGDWERINQQMASEKTGGFGQVQVQQEDYDMEL
jgi:hypothetical protein